MGIFILGEELRYLVLRVATLINVSFASEESLCDGD
jgi:hypothetical protein